MRTKSYIKLVMAISVCFLTAGSCPESSDKVRMAGPQEQASKNPLSTFAVSSAEEKFKASLAHMVNANQVKACYCLESPAYFLVHVLPLYHVNPTFFCGVRGNPLSEVLKKRLLAWGVSDEEIVLSEETWFSDYLQKSKKNLLLADTGTGYPWENEANVIYFPHGVDEDSAYINHRILDPNHRQGGISLLFSRFNESRQPSLEKIAQYYHLDKNKKTIFYAGTVGLWEFMDRSAPKNVVEHTLKQLVSLKKDYNIIIRPHPLQSKEILEEIGREFIIAPFQEFPSFVPFYEIADVVIGTPSAATTTATSRPELPLILLRPRITWGNEVDMDKSAALNKGMVLGDETAVVVNDKQITDDTSLRTAVEQALKETDQNHKRISARRKYFEYWFGCTDGYEEYRAWGNTLEKNLGIDITELKTIYKTFPKYKDRPLCNF